MRNAKTGALLAFFAEAERRETEEKSKAPTAPWETAKKPIQVDLLSMARARRRARA